MGDVMVGTAGSAGAGPYGVVVVVGREHFVGEGGCGGEAGMRTMEIMGGVPARVTGNAEVDAIVGRVIAAYAGAFAAHDLSMYLIGSWVDGDTNELSDIDMVAVWGQGAPDAGAVARGTEIARALESPIRLDVVMFGLEEVAGSAIGVNLKLGSWLVHGPDIRERVALPPLAVYREETVRAGRYFVFRVLRGSPEETLPLVYPAGDEEFFGYDRVRAPEWYPPGTERGLKELVTTGTRIARALVAVEAGRFVGSKGEAARVYAEVIGDGWAGLIEELYRRGKGEWGYRVPWAEGDRVALRELCGRFLGFERRFLGSTAER